MKKIMILLMVLSIIPFVSAGIWDNGVVAYYNFSQGSGNLVDITPQTFDQTPTNNPIRDVASLLSRAWNFTGADSEYTEVSSSVSQLTNFPFTMNAWIRTNTANNDVIMWIGDKDVGDSMHYLFISSGDLQVCSYTVASPDCTSSSHTYNNHEWQMVTGIWFSATNRTVYVNGTWLDDDTSNSIFGNALDRMDFARAGDTSPDGYYDGDIDEAGLWNRSLTNDEITWLYNSGRGVPFEDGPANVSTILSRPKNNTLSASLTVTFEVNSTTMDGDIVNVTHQMYNSAGSIYNTATVTGRNGTSNSTTFSKFMLDVGKYTWNGRSCAVNDTGDSICKWAPLNWTFWYGYVNNSQDYDATTPDSINASFTINLTLAASVLSSSVKLDYNGTTYTTTKSDVGDESLYQAIIDIPAVTTSVQKNLHWVISLTDILGTTEFNTSVFTQTVTPSDFSLCDGTADTVAVNFTTYDESNTTKLLNTTMDVSFTYHLGTGDETKNVSYTIPTNSSFKFCINPNSTYYVTSEMELSASGYETRLFNFFEEPYTNTTTETYLYLLNTSSSSDVIIQIVSEAQNPLVGYIVKAYKFEQSSNSYILVESAKTNQLGSISLNLILRDAIYRFDIYDTEGNLVHQIGDHTFNTAGVITTFTVPDSVDDFERFDYDDCASVDNLDCTLEYLNSTHIVLFTWNDNTGETSPTFRLLVQLTEFNGTTTTCNTTSTALSSSLSCNITGYTGTGTYRAQSFRRVSGENEKRLNQLFIKINDLTETFGLEGLFWSFILLFTFIVVGIFSPAVGFLLYIMGLIVLGIMGVVYVNPAIMIAQIVIAVIAIWAFKGG